MRALVRELIERIWQLLEFAESHPDKAEAADQRARSAELLERAQWELEQ